jgi:hypothetical protein
MGLTCPRVTEQDSQPRQRRKADHLRRFSGYWKLKDTRNGAVCEMVVRAIIRGRW